MNYQLAYIFFLLSISCKLRGGTTSGLSEKLVCCAWEFCLLERSDMLDVFRLTLLSALYCPTELLLLRTPLLCCSTLLWSATSDANTSVIPSPPTASPENRFSLLLLGNDLADNRGWKLKPPEALGVRPLESRPEGRDVWDLYLSGSSGGACRAGRRGSRSTGSYRRDRFCICRCMFCISNCCMVICCRHWFRVSISCCCCNCCCTALG